MWSIDTGRVRGPARKSGRACLVLVLTAFAAGCAGIQPGGPDVDLAGTWDGSVTADGQMIPGTLTLAQEGRILEAAFVAPDMGVNAEGMGEVFEGRQVRIELDYDFQCPGEAVLEGTVSDDGTRLDGTLEATDCTGTLGGTFRFTR